MAKKVKWKYEVGNHIIDEPRGLHLIITNRETRQETKTIRGKSWPNTEKYYECSCYVCGGTDMWRREHQVKSGCSYCCGRMRKRGINTIGDKYPDLVPYFDDDDAFNPEFTLESYYSFQCPVCNHRKRMRIGHLLDQAFTCDYCLSLEKKRPDLIQYLVNKEDALLPLKSSIQVQVKCPHCQNERTVPMERLSKQGFYCPRCDDGIPFTERLVGEVLRSLNINFITQAGNKVFDWIERRRYDFYLPTLNAIIETHGSQHYAETRCRKGIEQEQENDRAKEQLAKENGVQYYIVIDCRRSSLDWIKNSLLNSKLAQIVDMSNVDWIACTERATTNKIKEICSYQVEHPECSTSDLAKHFQLSPTTIVKYLKRGTNLGWCSYNTQEAVKQAQQKTLQTCGHPIRVWKNDDLIGTFESKTELSRQSENVFGRRVCTGTIIKACRLENYEIEGCKIEMIR
jgi:hypothetical protein